MPTEGAEVRVLHLGVGNIFGGIETFLLTLARRSDVVPDIEPAFAVMWPGLLLDRLRGERPPVHRLPSARLRNPVTIVRARRAFRDLLRAERLDVVVCHSPWQQVILGPVAVTHGTPLVSFVHGAPAPGSWLARLVRRVRPSLIIANSEYTRGSVKALFPSTPVEVCHLPHSRPPAFPVSERRVARSEMRTSPDDVVIIQVSRLEPWKGHTLLLDALARLRSQKGWTCWQVGGPQTDRERAYRDDLIARAEQLGLADRVVFAGHRDDVPRLLASADIHCQPNLAPEPFGLTFVEALFAGLPVVTTRLGGANEIVTPDCGVLVPPDDPVALADALDRLIGDAGHRSRLASGAPVRAAELCDVERQLALLGVLLRSASRPATTPAGHTAQVASCT